MSLNKKELALLDKFLIKNNKKMKGKNFMKKKKIYVSLLIVLCTIFVGIFSLNFFNNYNNDNKWKSILTTYCKCEEYGESVGIEHLSKKLEIEFDSSNPKSSYSKMIDVLKTKDASLYNSVKDYKVEMVAPLSISIFQFGNGSCKVLDKNGKDHYKELINKFISIKTN